MKRNLQSSRLLLLPVLALLLAGCGEDVPKTADQAVLRAANGLAENKPVVLWDALPTTYQKDVHEVVHSAVGKVDPDLWDQAFKTGQRLTKLLREKKDFILGHPLVTQMMQGQVVDKAEVDKQWDTFVGALDAVVNSEISSYEKAKTVNVGAFLDRTGSKVMEGLSGAAKSVKGGGEKPGEKNELVELYEKLKQTKATLVKEEGDKATVKLEVPGESATEEEFVRIEGKWLPKKMVDEWPKMIAEAKKEIAAISTEEMKKQKQGLMMGLAMVDGLLAPLEKAKTQQEFNDAIEGLMQMMQPKGGDGADPQFRRTNPDDAFGPRETTPKPAPGDDDDDE